MARDVGLGSSEFGVRLARKGDMDSMRPPPQHLPAKVPIAGRGVKLEGEAGRLPSASPDAVPRSSLSGSILHTPRLMHQERT